MYKAIFRVDGSHKLGMGDVVSCLNLALELKDFKVLDEKVDEKGNLMKILSFTIQNMKRFLKILTWMRKSSLLKK